MLRKILADDIKKLERSSNEYKKLIAQTIQDISDNLLNMPEYNAIQYLTSAIKGLERWEAQRLHLADKIIDLQFYLSENEKQEKIREEIEQC